MPVRERGNAMAILREHPYARFNFQVDLGGGGGGVDAGFTEVDGLGTGIDRIEYRAGNSKVATPVTIPGLQRFSDVTLRRGLIGSLTLWEWLGEVQRHGRGAARDVVIDLLDDEHEPAIRWKLVDAIPIGHVSGPLAAMTSDVALEELVLSHDGLRIE